MDDSHGNSITTYDSVDQIIHDLKDASEGLPEDALRAARERRDEIVPRLIEAIRTEAASLRDDKEWTQSQAPFFSYFLLWEFRAKEALPAILEAASLPEEAAFDLLGDAMTSYFGRVLATLADDSPELIEGLVADDSLNMYVRWEAAMALVYLVRDGKLTRERVLNRLEQELKCAMDANDADQMEGLVLALCEMAPLEARATIVQALEHELFNPELINIEDVDESIANGEQCNEKLPPTHIDDVIAELKTWAGFSDEDESGDFGDFDDEWLAGLDPESLDIPPEHRAQFERITKAMMASVRDEEDFLLLDEELNDEPLGETIRYDARPVGRNEPCPCGSGKKFKKCCGKPGD